MFATFVRVKQHVVLFGFVIALVGSGVAPLLNGQGVDAAKQRQVVKSEAHETTTRRFENTGTRLGIIDGPGTVATSSAIEVSGLSGRIVDVNVNLIDITHGPASTQDIDVLLVGPDGRTALILSDVGANTATSNVTLVLDDQQAEQLPSNAALTNGFFQPTNVGSPDTMNLGNGPTTVPSGASLGTFNGIDPNGTWRLYAYDDEPNGSSPAGGGINGGWAVTITAVDHAEPLSDAPTANDEKDKKNKKNKKGKGGKNRKGGKKGQR